MLFQKQETELSKRVETPDLEEEVELEEQVDGPIEIVAEVEEEVKEVPMVVEETKQSSSEATPTKKPKNKKNKIKIEEVVEQQPEPVVIMEEQKKATSAAPVNVKKANKKAKNENQETAKPKITSFEDIKNLVVKTPLDDFEIQNIVDSLLSKQTGTASSVQESWVEASKENETKALHRQLAENEALIIEERGKVKSLTEKMALLR